METSYRTHSAEETRLLGQKLAKELSPKTLLCLQGDLGSGKTTFTQGLLEGFSAEKPFVSPTFVIMKEYDLKTSSEKGISRIYHADAYRVEEKDFELLGFSEWYSDPEGLVILEWPERIESLLPSSLVTLSFHSLGENEREILVKKSL